MSIQPNIRRGDRVLASETFIPRPRAEVFAFFAAAENLERITPPELRFRITSPTPIAMATGSLIEYRLSLFGFPFHWKTLISAWDPESSFVDEQLRGPYATWIHTHTFSDVEGGTLVGDSVRYRLPLYPLSELAHPLIRLQLKRIFAYRRLRLEELLGAGAEIPRSARVSGQAGREARAKAGGE